MPFPASLTDAHNHYVYVNGAFERKYGYTLAALQGKDPKILVPNGTHIGEEFLAELRKGWTGQLENISRGGTRFRIGLRTMQVGAHGATPKTPADDSTLFLGVACDAGAEDSRDRTMAEMLMHHIISQAPVSAAACATATESLFARAPMRRKVHELLMEGRSYKEIAYYLHITDATVRVVVAELRKRLGEELVPRLRHDK